MGKVTIGIAGCGWGFWVVAESIAKQFNNIQLLNNDEASEVASFIKKNQNLKIRAVENLNHFDCALVICAGYKPIIEKSFLDSNTVVNIHYSLLPKYRGLHSTVWAILNDEPYLGYTVHLMNEFIDDGDIIFQRKVANIESKSSVDYMNEFNDHVQENIGSIIQRYLKGNITPISQNKSDASWVGKRTLEDCKINFNSTYKCIENMFRALVNPYPTPFFEFRTKKYFPEDFKFHASNVKTHIGRILNIDNEGIWVKIKDGYIIFNKLHTEAGDIASLNLFKMGNVLNKGEECL